MAVWLAPVLTALAFVVSGMLSDTYPFGPISRNVMDMGGQYVPLHAHLWDLLHGNAAGDLFFNWQSGFGVPFLPDFGYYLSSPVAVLVGLLPRDRIDLAVYLITVVKLAAAATAMAAYLVRLRPGPSWLAGVLGAAYGLCAWAIDEGANAPMWLDGLIAFPLFCLVGEWCLRRKRLLLSILVVAVFWFANFYTAYMATIGAGVVLLVRLLTSDLAWMMRLRAMLRFVLSVAVGVALTAPLLVPVLKANGMAHPSFPGVFRPISTDDFLARLLPLTDGVAAGPRVFVGTAALFLAATLPFNGSVPVVTRALWITAAILLAASFQWGPTQAAWHGFDVPYSNPFRQTFVLCGVLIIAGWLSVAHRPPGLPALGGATAALTGLALVVRDNSLLDPHSVRVFAISAVLACLAVLATRRLRVLPAVLLAAALLAEGSATAAAIQRDRAIAFWEAPSWQDTHATARSAVRQADGWPVYRTALGVTLTANDPLLIGGESGGYYSSFLPATVHRTLDDLGFKWSAYGKSMPHLDSPVIDALFSVGITVRGGAPHRNDVPPLVTVRPAPVTNRANTVFGRQEGLVGSRVYEVPAYRVTAIGPRRFRLDARCRAGSAVYLYLPFVIGGARLDGGGEVVLWSSRHKPWLTARGGLVKLGQVRPAGAFSVTLWQTGDSPGVPATGVLGCLDQAKLAGAVNRLRASGASEVRAGGHSIEATLPRPMVGVAVAAVPWVRGWQCARDGGGWQEPISSGGLLAVPLPEPTKRIACRYRPPGLGLGLAICGVAAVVAAGLALGARRGARPGVS